MGMSLRLLNVHAHPDDESSKGAATTAYYVAQGVEVMVATCTGGERGSILNPKMESPENWANLAALRNAEMANAAAILGIQQVWLGYVDSGMDDPLPEGCFAAMDVAQAAGPLVKVIREFRPQVLTTYDENGGYPHPDHIMCHRISIAAVAAAADPDAWPEHGEPWQVAKVYYDMSLHRGRFAALDAAMHKAGLERPYTGWLSQWGEDTGASARLTTFVPCSDYFEVRNAALRAHVTQIDPDGHWFAVPLEIQQAGWPTEDYQLVKSTVPVKLPESDLFAGLREPGNDSLGAWCYSI